MKRLLFVTGALVLVALGGFAWCERMGWLSETQVHSWVIDAGWRGALMGAGLLAGDVILPVPSSLVMILHGVAFGWAGGTVLSVAGSLIGAAVAYGFGRWVGPHSAVLAGGAKEDIAWLERFVSRYGAYVVIGSRPIPIMAEVVSCVAGYGRMAPGKFWVAAAAGTVPLCAVYAWWGAHQGAGTWLMPTLIGAVFLPLVGWGIGHVAMTKCPPSPEASARQGAR